MAGIKLHSTRARPPAAMSTLVCVILLSISVVYNAHLRMSLSDMRHELRKSGCGKPMISSRERMLEITQDNRELVYIPSADVVFMTMAKGGSTTLFHWLYAGLTGRPKFNNSECGTYPQDMRSSCWNGLIKYVFSLEEDEQWRVLTGSSTIRVAVQRDPFERLISSFKSKFTCEDKKYKTDLNNRERMVPQLLRQAELPENEKGCLSVDEFAVALDEIRRKVGSKGYKIGNLRKLDVHVRPQNFYFDEIDYDIVLDVGELNNVELLKPIVERLRYKNMVGGGVVRRHTSGGGSDALELGERTAKLLHRFAKESKVGQGKHYRVG